MMPAQVRGGEDGMCAVSLLSLTNLGLHRLSDEPHVVMTVPEYIPGRPAQTLVCDLRCKGKISDNNNYHLVILTGRDL